MGNELKNMSDLMFVSFRYANIIKLYRIQIIGNHKTNKL